MDSERALTLTAAEQPHQAGNLSLLRCACPDDRKRAAAAVAPPAEAEYGA